MASVDGAEGVWFFCEVGDDGLSLFVVDFESFLDDLFFVVVALVEISLAILAMIGGRWGIECFVIRAAALFAHEPAGEALDEAVVGDFEVESDNLGFGF